MVRIKWHLHSNQVMDLHQYNDIDINGFVENTKYK